MPTPRSNRAVHAIQTLGLAAAAAIAMGAGSLAVAQTSGASAPGAPTASATTASSLAASDRKWVEETAAAGMAEVAMGKLGQEKSQAEPVRQYGARMVQDHTKANEELMKIAGGMGVALPAQLPKEQEHRKHRDQLAAQQGAAFDKAFMNHMVDDHVKAVASFENQAKNGKNAELKAFAAKQLPTLRDHLASARSLRDSLK
jgi:putative membrane protein